MDLVLLGTGWPLPDPDRAGPATLVRAGGMHLLFDAGRGVLMRLRAANSGPVWLHTIFITHLHSDHITAFNDVLTMFWTAHFEPTPMRVIGPPGTQRFVDDTITMLQADIGWRIAHHADLTWEPNVIVSEVTQGEVFNENGVRVVAEVVKHPPVDPAIGFRIEHEGKSIVIAGDTIPCEGLDRLCAGADVYVQTVLRTPLIEALGIPRLLEILDYHSSTEDAARTAAKGGVRKLVYTHQMPMYEPGTEQDWINDAKPHFDGEVIFGKDLTVVDAS
jgi:ribonuclease Z